MSNTQVSLDRIKAEIESVAITDNIRLTDDDNLIIIDQVKLPNTLEYKKIDNLEDAYQAIKKLEVRGAPAIGIFAGYAMYVLCKKDEDLSYEEFSEKFRHNKEYLNSSRPTAVNLSWALNRINRIVEENKDKPVKKIVSLIREEAIAIHNEDIEMCCRICEFPITKKPPCLLKKRLTPISSTLDECLLLNPCCRCRCRCLLVGAASLEMV